MVLTSNMATTSSPEQAIIAQLWLLEGSAPEAQKLIAQACDYNRLAAELVNAATITRRYEGRFMRYLATVVIAEKISWATYLSNIYRFRRFNNHESLRGLCHAIDDALPLLKCSSFEDSRSARELLESVTEAFSWALNAVQTIGAEPFDDKGHRLLLYPLKTALNFVRNSFTGKLLAFANNSQLKTLVESVFKEFGGGDEPLKTMVEGLQRDYKALFDMPSHIYENECSNRYKMRKTSIRTLTSAFVCYRILYSVEDVADIVDAYAQIIGISFADVAFDMIHATLLIQVEECDEERHHHRLVFRWHVAVFFYLKLPKILAMFIKKHGRDPSEIVTAVEKILTRLTMTLDIVDTAWKDCTIRSFLKQLVLDEAMEEETSTRLIEIRYKQMSQNAEIAPFIKTDAKSKNDLTMLLTALDTAKTLAQASAEKLGKLLPALMMSAGMAFDALSSSFCVNGKMIAFSSKLALLNTMSQEVSSTVAEKAQTFDYSFLLLTRMSLNYPSIPLKLLVNGSDTETESQTNGIYFKWASNYLKCVKKEKKKKKEDEDEPMEETVKKDFAELSPEDLASHLQALKEGRPFWTDANKIDIKTIVSAIPSIGEALIEEYSQKNMDKEQAIVSMTNILTALVEMSSLFVCLVQWLDCQKDSPARRLLVQVIMSSIDKVPVDTNGKWLFVTSTLKTLLFEMSEKEYVYPEITTSAFTAAKRSLPIFKRSDTPSVIQLKRGWVYAQHQAWASPHMLRLLEHCNNAGEHKMWMKQYTTEMMKLKCSEMMVKAVDMIGAFLVLDYVNSITVMIETMTEYMFSENTGGDVRYEQPFVIPLVRQLTNLLILGAWTYYNESKKMTTEPVEKKAKVEEEETELEKLNKVLDQTVEKMFVMLKKGLLSSPTCVIFHLIQEIAGSPDSFPRKLLIKRIPPRLIFELSYINAAAVPYELFLTFCEPGNEEHEADKLRLLCALRRRNII